MQVESTIMIIFLGSLTKVLSGEVLSNAIVLDDILSEDYMPGTILMLENPGGISKFINNTDKSRENTDLLNLDGTLVEAMNTMNYHRSMMNQYLCRSFLAEQIVSNMSTFTRVKRRMGHVTPGIGEPTTSSRFDVKNNLIYDEGSSGYKDWLTKSTTLEDIYRHYDKAQNKIDVVEEPDENNEDFEIYNVQDTSNKQQDKTLDNHRQEDSYYSGNGYSNNYSPPDYQHSGGGGGGGYSSGGGGYSGGGGGYSGGTGYSGGGGGGYQAHQPESHITYEQPYNEPEYHKPEYHKPEYFSPPPKYHVYNYYTKDKDLADLFEIALTGLAFLAFKMFIVHVIMCITSVSNNSTTTAVSMAMSMSPTATGTGTGMDTGTGGGMDMDGGTTGTGGGNTGGTGSTGSGTTSNGNGGGGSNTGTGDGTTSTGEGTNANGDGTPSTGGGTTGTGDTMDGETTSTGGGTADTGEGTDNGEGINGEENGTNDDTPSTGGGTNNEGDDENAETDMGSTGEISPGISADGDDNGSNGDDSGTAVDDAMTGSTGTDSERDTFQFRLRRAAMPTISNPNNQVLNELARRVLVTIESTLVAHKDDGICLKKTLCENNKWSRNLDGKHKIFIPLWSLGMSWLSGRIVKNVAPSTSMLDTLKASILGLGKANCEIIYQKCDLRKQVTERRKRRRKRKRETFG